MKKSLFYFEYKKVTGSRNFFGFFCLLLLLGGFLCWQGAQGVRTYSAASYRQAYTYLRTMPLDQAVIWTEEHLRQLDHETIILEMMFCESSYWERSLFEDIRNELESQAGQPEYLQSVLEQAENIQSFSFLSKDSFDYRNLRQTVKDYQTVKPLTYEQVDPEQGIRRLVENPWQDLFLILIICFLGAILVSQDFSNGFSQIAFSSRKGRGAFLAAKAGAMLFFIFIAWMLLSAVLFLVFGNLYGLGDLSRPIQTVSAFSQSLFSGSIRSFLAVWWLGKLIGFFLLGLWLIAFLRALRNETVCFLLILGIWALGWYFWTSISENSFFRLLKYGNPFFFLHVEQVLGTYVNLNLFGTAVPIRYAWTFSTVFLAVAGGIFLRAIRARFFLKAGGRKRRKRLPGTAIRGLFQGEFYKGVVVCRLGLLFAAVFLFQIYAHYGEEIRLGYEERIYQGYLDRWEGYLNGDQTVDRKIEQERARFESLWEEYDTLGDGGGEELKKLEIQNQLEQETVFLRAVDRYEKLSHVARERENPPLLFYDGMYDRLISDTERDMRNGLFALALLTFCVVEMTVMEHISGMKTMCRSYARGGSLGGKKIILAGLCVILTALLIYTPDFLLVFRTYSPHSLWAPLYSIAVFRDYTGEMTVGVYLLLMYGVRILAMFAAALQILGISTLLQKRIPALAVNLLYLGLPFLGYLNHIAGMESWGLAPALAANPILQNPTAVTAGHTAVQIILATGFGIFYRRSFRPAFFRKRMGEGGGQNHSWHQ